MKFKTTDIRACALGVDRVERVGQAWRLQRLPAKLGAIYSGSDEGRARAESSSGVRLRFKSNTRWIRLKLRYGIPARWYFMGAVVVDGERSDVFGPVSRQETWSGTIFTQVRRQAHTFDIWFAHLCPTDIMAVEIEDGSSLAASRPAGPRWVAYGDSITQGMNATLPIFAWPSRCALALNAEVINYGVGGATLRREFADSVADTTADIVTISLGANDFMTDVPPATVGANARALLDALRRQHAKAALVVTTPVPLFRNTGANAIGATLDDYRHALANAAANRPNVHVISGLDLVPADHGYFNDYSHPNDRGMQSIAENMSARLKQLAC